MGTINYYAEIARIIQEYSEREGLSYEEGLDKAKKLLSERTATQKTENNLLKNINNSITAIDKTCKEEDYYGRKKNVR